MSFSLTNNFFLSARGVTFQDTASLTWALNKNLNQISATVLNAAAATSLAGGVLGSVPYQSAANVTAFVAGNITTTKKFWTQTGNGSISAAPAWGTIAVGDVPTLNQNTSGSSASCTGNAATATTAAACSGNSATATLANAISGVTVAPNATWPVDLTAAATLIQILNNGTYDLAVGSGFTMLYENGGAGAAYAFSAFGATVVTNIAGTLFTNTLGSAGKVNFAYNGTTAYRIENKSGSTVNIYVTSIRARPST